MSDALRREHGGEGLTESELAVSPWQQARAWVDDAVHRWVERDDVPEPLAMSVATIDAAGRPDVRTNAASPDPLLISAGLLSSGRSRAPNSAQKPA